MRARSDYQDIGVGGRLEESGRSWRGRPGDRQTGVVGVDRVQPGLVLDRGTDLQSDGAGQEVYGPGPGDPAGQVGGGRPAGRQRGRAGQDVAGDPGRVGDDLVLKTDVIRGRRDTSGVVTLDPELQ